jgi:hypothetical protein
MQTRHTLGRDAGQTVVAPTSDRIEAFLRDERPDTPFVLA